VAVLAETRWEKHWAITPNFIVYIYLGSWIPFVVNSGGARGAGGALAAPTPMEPMEPPNNFQP